MMKSLCISAPFWKTESGMSTLGLPEGARVTGAKRLIVLFSEALIFSTREGGSGRRECVVELRGSTSGEVV